jgi:hypothetical protein
VMCFLLISILPVREAWSAAGELGGAMPGAIGAVGLFCARATTCARTAEAVFGKF